jgi:hypothetical protein
MWGGGRSMGGGGVWAVANIGHIRMDRVGIHHHDHNVGDHGA